MDIWLPKDFRTNEQGDDYSDAKHERQPHGLVIVNGKEVATTLQCPHCSAHFISRTGSGHRRSFCMRCMAVTCGAHACVTGCAPWAAASGELIGREV